MCLFFNCIVPDIERDITLSRNNSMLVAGTKLQLNCIITLSTLVIDNSVSVSSNWLQNGFLINNGSRIFFNQPQMMNESYSTSLTLNPLNVSDTGTYICNFGISGDIYVNSVFTQEDTMITVEGKLLMYIL